MFMFMLRPSAGALSVSACALSVRRAQRPRAQSNRRAAATEIVHWAQLGADAGSRNRLLAQHSRPAPLCRQQYAVIAEPKRLRTFSLVSLPLAYESEPSTREQLSKHLRHPAPSRRPSSGNPPARGALRNSGPDTEVPVHCTGWCTHCLGARELKRSCPASQVTDLPPGAKQGCRSKSQGCPRARRTNADGSQAPLPPGCQHPGPAQDSTPRRPSSRRRAEAQAAARNDRQRPHGGDDDGAARAQPRRPVPRPCRGICTCAVAEADRRPRGHRTAFTARSAGRRVPPARGLG